MHLKHPLLVFTLIAAALLAAPPASADLDSDILMLQQRWAEVNYQLEGKTRLSGFEHLVEEAEGVVEHYPTSAQAWIWSGIIKSTYAGAKGGLGALKLAKSSKADLERALELDPRALHGSAYTSLGALYYNVPGWPVGFGDEDKAEDLLREALDLDPDGIDSNYFFGDYLANRKRYEEAESYFLKAQSATPRPDRPVADAGRQEEIRLALLEVRKKLGN